MRTQALLILSALFWLSSASAQKVDAAKPKVPPQYAVVGVEGATVYSQPDFDSEVVVVLPPGLKLSASHRRFPGRTGLGLFYRVSYKKKMGYVADTELIPEFKKQQGKRAEKNPLFEDVESLRERALKGQESIYETRFIGFLIGTLNYTEKFHGKSATSGDTLYGVRLTGPKVISDFPVDLNILFSPKAPSYYGLMSRSEPGGFYADLELSFLVPLAEENHYMLYAGLGFNSIYSKLRVEVEPSVFVEAQKISLGALLTGGLALRFDKWSVRGDLRYYYENTSYFGYWATLAHEL